ncbi:hypothetical protein Tdes44962_MAKER09480 [Teratosphaeria destructans]|uniref:Uncharacterized protein n=1 Tax=Teratosphaeria destructans TaxID=418781 RepID=A0A9W7W2Q8_9PEZI|nr:hypothetical protein Tdes44962_MAKER09480 [Teratosphaeria destructans]
MATVTGSQTTTSATKEGDCRQTIPFGVARGDSATDLDTQEGQEGGVLPDLKDLITAPRTAFEGEGDLVFQMRCLQPSPQEMRQGLSYALFELKTLLRRVQRGAAREAVQTALDDLQVQEAGLLSSGPKGMLSNIARFVQARWYLAKKVAFGKVSTEVLKGVRVWDPVCVRRA